MSTVEVTREVPGGVLRIVPAPPEAMPDAVSEPPTGPAEPESAPPRAEEPNQPVFDMRDVPLGTLLHRSGLVTAEQLGSALAEGSRTRQRLGEVLVQRGWIDDAHLSRLLAGQKGLPFIELGVNADRPRGLQALGRRRGARARRPRHRLRQRQAGGRDLRPHGRRHRHVHRGAAREGLHPRRRCAERDRPSRRRRGSPDGGSRRTRPRPHRPLSLPPLRRRSPPSPKPLRPPPPSRSHRRMRR